MVVRSALSKPAGFRHVPRNDIAALRAAVGPQTAGVLIEPIQGEGGVHVIDEAFLIEARSLCDQHDALLLFDEVQTGIGRCGAWFAFQRTTVRPDAVVLAKGLASGMPIGALLSKRLATGFRPGDHGTTFGGSPPIAAAALATIEVVEREAKRSRLRELEQEGIVERQRLPELPPRVEYALTDKGRALLPMIEDMRCFGEQWLEGAADTALVAPGA